MPKPGRIRRWAVRAGIFVFCITLTLLAFGMGYETLAERRFRVAAEPPGELISVGSYRLHLYCTGSGTPPVILEAGSGLAYSNWTTVQAGLTEVTRVCSYDRDGLGWSDRSAVAPSASHAVSDLRALLDAAGDLAPWIVVGHSLGGLYAQQLMNLHPQYVAALVLLDPAHEEQFARVPRWAESVAPGALEQFTPMLTIFGLHRISLPRVEQDDPTWASRQLHATSKHLRTAAVEWWNMDESAAEVRTARRPWGDVPLVVFGAGAQVFPPEWTAAEIVEAERHSAEMLQELAGRSTRGEYVVVEDSGHGIPWERPDTVIATIKELLGELRSGDGSDGSANRSGAATLLSSDDHRRE